jgi:HNH endonuclease
MDELRVPDSSDELVERLRFLHQERERFLQSGELARRQRRLSLTPEQRSVVLQKTAARCHLCGGEIKQNKFAADHVLSHAAGGKHELDNYLAAHRLCNGCRWFYLPEEFQWILKIGVWSRKQMEDRTAIGLEMVERFLRHEKNTRKRRKSKQQAAVTSSSRL